MIYKIMKLKKWIKINKDIIIFMFINKNSSKFLMDNKQHLFDNMDKCHRYLYYTKNNETHKWDMNINWDFLCNHSDIYTMNILENNLDKIDWCYLSENPNAIHILEKNIDKINWNFLCSNNYNAHLLLKNNFDKINWKVIVNNKNAIFLLTDNIQTLTWTDIYNKLEYFEKEYYVDKQKFISSFSRSDNKYVLQLLYENPDKIDWDILCDNKNGYFIVEKYIDIIPFSCLCMCEKMINYILEHIEEYNKNDSSEYYTRSYWNNLCRNPAAIDYLEKHQDKICYDQIYLNENIFEYDFEIIINKINIYKNELIQKVFHPNRLLNISKIYNVDFINVINNY
jgi:hypothetical protein